MNVDFRVMTDEQLLSAILGSNVHLTEEYSLNRIFTVVSEEQIGEIKGIGNAKAKTIAVIKEIVRRVLDRKRETVKTIKGCDDVFEYFQFLAHREVEEIWVMLLNCQNGIIGTKMVSRGTVSRSMTSPREIMNYALKHMASGIILVHNHPAGSIEPSKDDIEVTRKMIEAGEIINVPLIDHVIIGTTGNTSIKGTYNELWSKFRLWE